MVTVRWTITWLVVAGSTACVTKPDRPADDDDVELRPQRRVANDRHVDPTAVTDEANFQRLLREQPDDAPTWLVYADWLEGQGDAKRAQVVRHHRLLANTTDAKDAKLRLSLARQLLTLAKGLPRQWLRTLAKHSIANTCWGTRDFGGGVYLLVFGKHGIVHFKQGDPFEDEPEEAPTAEGDGTWMQIGDAVTFSVNDFKDPRKDFSRQDGVLAGVDIMFGVGSNADKEAWEWELHKLARTVFDEDLPDLPEWPADTESKTAKVGALLPRRRWA